MDDEENLVIAAAMDVIVQDDDDDYEMFEELLQPSIFFELDLYNGRGDPTLAFLGISNFSELTVAQYSERYFKKHFRISREAFTVTVLKLLCN